MKNTLWTVARRLDRLSAAVLPHGLHLRLKTVAVCAVRWGTTRKGSRGSSLRESRIRPALRWADRMADAMLPRVLYLRLRRLGLRLFAPSPSSQSAWRAPWRRLRNGSALRISVLNGGRDDTATPIDRFLNCDGSERAATEELRYLLAFNRQPCKVVMCCAFRGRHRLLRHVVMESLSGRYGAEVRWMLVGSTPEDFLFIRSLGRTTGRVAGFIAQNRPLGAKWQSAVRYAGSYFDAELLGITGSDDIVSHHLIDSIIEMRSADAALCGESGLRSTALYGTQEWLVLVSGDQFKEVPQVIKCNYSLQEGFEPLGAGRFYAKEFLQEVDYLIFDGHLNRCLDDRGYFSVRDRGRQTAYYAVADGALVSVKGNWEQLNDLSSLLEAPQVSCQEYSFEGHRLLEQHLSQRTHGYLFRTGRITFQFPFSAPPTGVVPPPMEPVGRREQLQEAATRGDLLMGGDNG